MTTLFIDTKQFAGVKNDLCNYLNGQLKVAPLGNVIELDGKKGAGTIFCAEVASGVSLVTFDTIFYEDVTLKIDTLSLNPLYFIYAIKGGVKLKFKNSGKKEQLDDFQSMIISSSKADPFEYQFKEGQHYKLIIVRVDREKYLKKADFLQHGREVINLMFRNSNPSKTLTFTYGPDLSIAEVSCRYCYRLIKGTMAPLEVMGAINLLMSHILGQHDRDGQEPHLTANLTNDDVTHVQKLALHIRENPAVEYKVLEMAAMTGLNPYKLQQAFKYLYKRTAADYIRHVRLEEAERLLKKNELNVSEVVLAVGLNSNSYFSKIFKEKYDCCPKEYQERIKRGNRGNGALNIAV